MINNNDDKKMKDKFTGKKVYLLAAALSAALIGSQAPLMFVSAEASDAASESYGYSSVIPDNVTIENPTELANVSLPDTEYGSLVWADGSYVPTKRVQSCEVILKPAAGKDMTGVSGWSSEAGGIVGYINVIVNSIPSSANQKEEIQETEKTEDETSDAMQVPEKEEETADAVVTEIPETADQTETAEITETPAAENTEKVNDAQVSQDDENADETKTTTETPILTEITGEIAETPAAEIETITETPETAENEEEKKDSLLDISDSITEDDEETQEDNNIFDNPVLPAKDDRPVDAEEELSEEEKQERAQINHTYDGITVSGENLPWYVQFRVSSGDEYQFENESDATIFQSYEFELWDLQTDTEYEIPNGEYISVTVPVKEGYQYTIEHLLDNGATETIIPSVEGNTMVFSTHSFSPFGIAGSKQLVGPDVVNEEVTPTPAENSTAAVTPAAAQSASSVSSDSVSSNSAVSDQTTSSADNSSNTLSASDSSTSDNQTSTDDTQQSADNSSKSQSAVKTGDNTTILPFVVGLIAAIVVIVGIVIYMRRKRK